ncbi:hypothetical protein BDP27DRAFT_1260199 [Rhodocollybia butyracea]|uniref:Uncharacterized protein n=1 Tax=Rhodocollybia butyracea TaxID=206335 RepID=A0A9P5Q2Q9_9AGAR|nr:hypothetical protein BDP27DRAFT_1260199 [Rhodocollybia butyracea]
MANFDIIFAVDDTSPTIHYSPFSDTAGPPNFTAGWNPLFNQTSFGGAPLLVQNSSSTVHVTSLNNASFSLQWNGTGIQLVGYATDASYTILVDGSLRDPNATDMLLASVQNLDNAFHEISLTTNISDPTTNQTQSFIVFNEAVIETSPMVDSNATDSMFSQQPLNDASLSFRGDWSFENNTSPRARSSSNFNDSVAVDFNGTALLIFGTVSPEGGNYTVQLDNIPTQNSAEASFIQNNTLLFYASGLDPNVPHNVQLFNDGGTLTLPIGGFVAFSTGNPNLVSPTGSSASPTSNLNANGGSALAQGTIAALVLAGILAFLLFSSLLFYIFVWRPRKIRQRRTVQPHEMRDSGSGSPGVVLDIARHTPDYPDPSPTGSRRSQKSSGRSGFLRWKREVEASTKGGKAFSALGLIFRHSDSTKDKGRASQGEDEDLYEDSSSGKLSRTSSLSGSPQSPKGKGKSRHTGKSKQYDPSFTVELPSLSKEKLEVELPDRPPAAHTARTSGSGFTSLTYMSTPDTENSREFSFNAPSSQISDSSQPQGAVSPSHVSREGQDRSEDNDSEVVYYLSSVASTRQEPDPEVHVHEMEVESTNATSSNKPSHSVAESRRTGSLYTREMDRGSVRTNDDGLSVLGPATARAAIRGLSPRTSELAFLSMDQLLHAAAHQGLSADQRLVSDETLRPHTSAFMNTARSSSPSHPNPVQGTSNRKTTESSKKSARLSVRFEDDGSLEPEDKGKGPAVQTEQRLLAPSSWPHGKGAFRLTPQHPITSPVSEGDSIVTTSFLDLSGSNSNSNSDSSQRAQSLASQGQGFKSRWSTTTGTGTDPDSHNPRQQSSESQTSGASGASASSNFPFPVSLPASPHHPEGFKPSPPTVSVEPPRHLDVSPHPFEMSPNPTSPSDSVPMSISDLHFRHSDSENEELVLHPAIGPSSHLPPHPPLPSSVPPTPTFPPPNAAQRATPPTSSAEALSTPSYIVSRVFAHSRSGSAVDQQFTPVHRTFGNLP